MYLGFVVALAVLSALILIKSKDKTDRILLALGVIFLIAILGNYTLLSFLQEMTFQSASFSREILWQVAVFAGFILQLAFLYGFYAAGVSWFLGGFKYFCSYGDSEYFRRDILLGIFTAAVLAYFLHPFIGIIPGIIVGSILSAFIDSDRFFKRDAKRREERIAAHRGSYNLES